MNFEVETGVGSPTANSYCSVDFADHYFDIFYPENESWTEMSEQQKQMLLVYCTRFFDSILVWTSNIKNENQALAFPRRDFRDNEGRKVDENSIPWIIQETIVDFANEHLVNGLSKDVLKLIREDFADTSDTYSSPKIIKGSVVVYDITLELISKGYGTRRNVIEKVWRA